MLAPFSTNVHYGTEEPVLATGHRCLFDTSKAADNALACRQLWMVADTGELG